MHNRFCGCVHRRRIFVARHHQKRSAVDKKCGRRQRRRHPGLHANLGFFHGCTEKRLVIQYRPLIEESRNDTPPEQIGWCKGELFGSFATVDGRAVWLHDAQFASSTGEGGVDLYRPLFAGAELLNQLRCVRSLGHAGIEAGDLKKVTLDCLDVGTLTQPQLRHGCQRTNDGNLGGERDKQIGDRVKNGEASRK